MYLATCINTSHLHISHQPHVGMAFTKTKHLLNLNRFTLSLLLIFFQVQSLDTHALPMAWYLTQWQWTLYIKVQCLASVWVIMGGFWKGHVTRFHFRRLMTSLRFALHYDLFFCPSTQVSPNITIFIWWPTPNHKHSSSKHYYCTLYFRFVLFLCFQYEKNNRASCIPFWCPLYWLLCIIPCDDFLINSLLGFFIDWIDVLWVL